MNVKFLKKWDKYRAGEEASFPLNIASVLLSRGFAVEVKPEKPKKAEKREEKKEEKPVKKEETKNVKSPPKDKMVKSSASKKE
jgi:hypothetical protein